MDSHVRYLDELKLAIKESRLIQPFAADGGHSNENGETSNDDLKSLKILNTMIRNLRNAERNDIMENNRIFASSVEVLDLLIRSKPYLLKQSENKGDLTTLVSDLLDISILNYMVPHRMWFLRRKLGGWCNATVLLYGNQWKLKLSEFISEIVAKCEKNLMQVFADGCEKEFLIHNLRRLYVIFYWLAGPPDVFGNSLTMSNSSLGVNLWDFHFQKLIRMVFYLFSSLQEPKLGDELAQLPAKYLSLVVEYFINKTAYYAPDSQTFSADQLRFTLNIMSMFLRNKFGRREDDLVISKCLLRVYSMCVPKKGDQVNDNISIFTENFPLAEGFDARGILSAAEPETTLIPYTNMALYLIQVDIRRRTTPISELKFDIESRVWYSEADDYELLKRLSTHYTSNDSQFEGLYYYLLRNFYPVSETGRSLPLSLIPSEITLKPNDNLETLMMQLARIIKAKLLEKNFSDLIGLIKTLGKLACFESEAERANIKLEKWETCMICDSIHQGSIYRLIDTDRPKSENCMSYKLLNKILLSNPELISFPESLLAALLITLQRIFTHYQPPQLSDFQVATPKKHPLAFVEGCFVNTSRYLRVLSARLIPLWNVSSYNSDDQNTAALVQFLQNNDAPYATETSVMAWAQLAITASGEVFDTLLLKLIDIFNSHDYALHIMVAFQIRSVALTLGKTPYQLLSPILPILLRQIGKNLLERRVSFQRLIWLLGYSAKTILEIYQRYIIPHAVTQYKSDVFSEIARIMSDGDVTQLNETKKILLDKNSRQIFAVALVKHGLLSIDTLESLFSNRVPSFDKRYISAYLPDYKTLAEVLKLSKTDSVDGSTSTGNDDAVLIALRYVMTNFDKDKRHGSKYKNISDWNSEQEQRFQKKLQEHILGVFQVFSSDIHDAEGRTTYFEKLRVVNGIAFLIKQAGRKSIIASLAQISICLQTGLEIYEVRPSALKCWKLLVLTLDEEELATVIDGLICFILQRWDEFDSKLNETVNDVLDILVKYKRNLLLKIKPYLTLALLTKKEADVLSRDGKFARAVSHVINSTDWVSVFASNLKSTNKYVIHQTLDDLEIYLKRKQTERSAELFNKVDPVTSVIVVLGSLLDTSHKFKSTDGLLCEKSARCISIIGALDATKHKIPRGSTATNEVYDLNNHNQTISFLIWVTNDILVPAFWQSENPSKQLFVALVMQESLKFCGLSSASWDVNKRELYPKESTLWDRFNNISKTTLYPLLSSLYLAQSWKEYVPLRYPSYTFRDGYVPWIKNVCLDLLKTGTDEDHPLHVFSSLIREDDGSFSNFLLPYVLMDVIIKADSDTNHAVIMSNIIEEFKSIFEIDLDGLNHLQIDSLKMCYQSIFRVFEYCKKWITQYKQAYYQSNGTFIIKELKLIGMLRRIEDFLDSFPPVLLAQRSLQTNSFERSALYLEKCYRQKLDQSLQDEPLLRSLQKTYEEIGDIDSIDGLLKTFSSGRLASKIEELQYSENWKMAQDCYDTLGSFADESVAQTKMLTSMYDHQLYSKLLVHLERLANGRQQVLNDEMTQWYKMGMEAANLEGKFEGLSHWIDRVETLREVKDPELLLQYNTARALSYVRAGHYHKVRRYLDRCFKITGIHFTASTIATTLLKKQALLMKLHSLHDISLLSASNDGSQFQNSTETLDFRMRRVGADFEPNHYILSMRKSYDRLKEEPYSVGDLGTTFFNLSRLCRDSSRLDLASESLMHCLQYNHPQTELEFAEILLKQGENDRAVKLVREINEKYKDDPMLKPRDKAIVLLKYTEWLDLTNNSASEQIIEQYQKIFQLDPQWDKPYYSIGLYYSKLLERKKAEGYVTNGKLEYMSISYFLLAFEKNTIKVREILPKVVTFWLDIAAESIKERVASRREALRQATEDICRHIEEALRNSPAYIWYPVLTQLLSRLLHDHPLTSELITKILLNLTVEYPSHILWYISGLLNSTSSSRVSRGREIIEKYRKHADSAQKLVSDAADLTTAFTKVCLKDIKNINSRSGRSLERDFRFDMSMAPSDMAVPVRVNLEMVSPLSAQSMKSFRPFQPVVTIARFGSSYKVFSSLKKPKKLSVIGSDGRVYGIMCKKEDVRQDNQYMQFATTMDFLLKRDVNSMKRDLGITTYSVLSLREDCGLLEIVPNVITLRSIFVTKYESLKIKYSLKNLCEKWQHTPENQKLQFYREQLSSFPPILYQWFLETFPDPITWFNARNTYARSYAVMAMVGHILGLGDRHCENILLNIETGGVLHVDFDCLFEKGRRLPVPEIVPFRLTQNLHDALGVVGTEGTFKKSSEVTVSLMRDNEVSLVNVIETIMYDRNMDSSIQKALKVLRNKIRGIDPRDGLVLSVPGQVEALIQESTSEENLSKMYIGWLSFW